MRKVLKKELKKIVEKQLSRRQQRQMQLVHGFHINLKYQKLQKN